MAENLSKRYDELCEMADAVFREYNPCNIVDGKCIRRYFCCNGCKYLIENKCSVKSLLCKIWVCDKATIELSNKGQLVDFRRKINTVYDEASKLHLLVFRGSKEDVFRQLITRSNNKAFVSFTGRGVVAIVDGR